MKEDIKVRLKNIHDKALDLSKERRIFATDRKEFIPKDYTKYIPEELRKYELDNISTNRPAENWGYETRFYGEGDVIVLSKFSSIMRDYFQDEDELEIYEWVFNESVIVHNREEIYYISYLNNDLIYKGNIRNLYRFPFKYINSVNEILISAEYKPKKIYTVNSSYYEKRGSGLKVLADYFKATKKYLYTRREPDILVDNLEKLFTFMKEGVFMLDRENGVVINKRIIKSEDAGIIFEDDTSYIFIVKEDGEYSISITAPERYVGGFLVERYRIILEEKTVRTYEFIGPGSRKYGFIDANQLFIDLIGAKFIKSISVDLDNNVFDNTVLRFYKEAFDENNIDISLVVIINLMLSMHLEILYKNGFQKEILNLINGMMSLEAIDIFLKERLGDLNKSSTNMKGLIGLNSFQIKEATKNKSDFMDIGLIRLMKLIDNIRSVDNETSIKIINLIRLGRGSDKYRWGINIISQDITEVIKMIVDRIGFNGLKENYKLLKTIIEGDSPFTRPNRRDQRSYMSNLEIMHNRDTLGEYKDYLRMINGDEDIRGLYPLFPENFEELTRLHDEVMGYINLKRENFESPEYRELVRKFEDVSRILSELEYSGSKYSIIAPKHPKDLVVEGVKLSHCVKSYVESFADNKVGILFVRLNTDISEPLYTLELSDTFDTVQFKGQKNSIPPQDAQDFVELWKEEMNKINKKDTI